jgi:hypothetical protein
VSAIVDAQLREDGAAAAPPRAMRLVNAGVEDALDRFSDPGLLAAGKVNVISLEAVEARFGVRWSLRQDQVYDFATRVLERGVGDTGFFMRVSGTDFFIVHPDLGRLAGQAACLRYLREVLNHFLGESEMAALGVLQVTKISRGELEAKPVEDVLQGQVDDEPEPAPAPRTPPDDPARHPLDRWTPFVASDGRHLRVTATLEPVYEMKGFTRIGFRMVRRVIVTSTEEELSPQQVSMLSTGDLLRVDLATIVRGLGRLAGETPGEQHLSLIVPLSFTSLSSQRGRTEFAKQIKEAGGLVRLGVICEICDIEGVPPGALLAATSLLRPFTLLVVGRMMDTTPTAIGRLQGSGLQAISFECPQNLGEAEFMGWATSAITAAKRLAKSVMVYRARSPKQAATLASLGASHVSVTTG